MLTILRRIAVLACVAILVSAPAFCEDADQQAYDDFKESYDGFKGVYEKTKSAVDTTTEFFGKFNEALTQWRGATSREFQDGAIESITELTKEHMGAIDAAAERLSELTGISIPESVPESIKNKLNAKLFDSLPKDKQRNYGYMYTLSSIDRRMRQNGAYERLASLKEQFDAGSELLGNVDKAIEFMDMFNPRTDGSVTGSLKKIKGVLGAMGELTDGIPLMGDIIKGYADVTEGFTGALEDLDKKLKDSRQGSLGGQLGVDAAIKRKILAEYPGIEGELTLYFSINGEYPLLAPIRGWKNDDVLLYHGDDDGSGQVARMNGAGFGVLYRYYAALKGSSVESAQKLANPEMFMSYARAAGASDLSAIDARFKALYEKFEGSGNYEFLQALALQGKTNDSSFLVSEGMRVMEYQVYSRKQDLFCGLCYFNRGFRAEAEALVAKYYGMRPVGGEVKSKGGKKIEGLVLAVNGTNVTKLRSNGDSWTFEAAVKKDAPWELSAAAPGFKECRRGAIKEGLVTVELEPEEEAAGAASITIIAPDTAEAGAPFSFAADIGTATLRANETLEWIVAYKVVATGLNGTFTPEQVCQLTLEARINSRSKSGVPSIAARAVKKIDVEPARNAGITLAIDAPKDVLLGRERVEIKVKATGAKPMQYVSQGLRDETRGQVLLEPNSWGNQPKENWSVDFSRRWDVPREPGEYVLVYEIFTRNSKKENVVVASARHTVTVHSLGLKVLAQVAAMEKFQASVSIPASAGAVKEYYWSPYDAVISGSEWGRTASPSVTMQLRNDQIMSDGTVRITCSVKDGGTDIIGSETVQIPVKPVTFGAAVPGAWEGGPYNFKKKPAVRKRMDNGKEVNSATVWGSVDIVLDRPTSVFYNAETARNSLQEWAQKEGAKISAITISGFEGFIAEREVRSRYGGNPWGYVDVGTVKASALGKALLFNGAYTLSISYYCGGEGLTLGTDTPWWDDMPFVLQNTEQTLSEIQSIISSINIRPDASVVKSAEPEKRKEPKVRLQASKTRLSKGEAVEVKAVVEDAGPGDEPFTYAWSGNYAGKGGQVTFLASQSGKQSIAVTVRGARYPLGSASLEFEVEQFDVKVQQEKPATPRIIVGAEAAFSATIAAGGRQDGIQYMYRWEPHPEVTFEPHEGTAARTTAKFTKPGRTKVWVEVLRKQGDTLTTMGSSDQLEIEAVQPELKLTLSKTAPLPGEEIKARVDGGMDANNIDYRWELTPNAKLVRESRDTSEIDLYAIDEKPVTVTVRARVPVSGEDLGASEAKFTAKPYAVKAEVLGPLGPRPMVWKEGQGLVEEKTAIKTFQNVRLKVTIEPQPKDTVTYQWKLNSGSSFASGQSGSEIMANRSEKGACEATVEVSNSGKILLGTARASFNVTVSDQDIADTKKKDDESRKKKEALDKVARARELAREGKLDDALALAEEAAGIDPLNGAIAEYRKSLATDRQRITESLERMKTFAGSGKFSEAKAALDTAAAVNARYQPVVDAQRLLDEMIARAAAKEKDSKDTGSAKDTKDTKDAASAAVPVTVPTPPAATPVPGASEDVETACRDEAAALAAESDRLMQQYRSNVQAEKEKYRDISLITKAIETYAASLKRTANKEVEEKTAAAKSELESRKQFLADVAAAENLREEGRQLAAKNKYREAIEKLEKSLALFTPPDSQALRRTIETLKAGLRNEEADKQWAEGEQRELKRQLVEALEKYDQALKGYDPQYPDLMQRKARAQNVRTTIAVARQRKKAGEDREKLGKLSEAAADYDESVKLLPDAELERHVAELRRGLERRKKEADKLAAQAEALEQKLRLEEAAGRYADAIKTYYPGSPEILTLQARLSGIKAAIAKAAQLRSQGELKEKKGQLTAALADYGASLAVAFNEELSRHSDELRRTLAEKRKEGDALLAEAEKLDRKGMLPEAAAKYEAALKAWPAAVEARPAAEARIREIKGTIARAAQLKRSGQQKEQRKQLKQAVADYEQSLALVPDSELAVHVKELKTALAAGNAAGPGPLETAAADGMDEVRRFYDEFAQAYGRKNESRLMSFIGSGWSAGDGTTLTDLRNYLHNSFSVFDEIRYVISNLAVKKAGPNRYRASYTVRITGRIFENDIRHEERSEVSEEVTIDDKGRVRIQKTSDGRFWVVE